MKHILICSLLLTSMISIGQVNVDSLLGIWNNTYEPDTSRILALKDIIEKGYLFSNPDTAFVLAQDMHDFADSMGMDKWKGTALNYQGISCAIRGHYDEAIRRFTRCLTINEQLGNQHRVASSLNNIGLIYQEIDEHDRALEYFEKSQSIYQDIDDQYGLGIAFANTATEQNKLGLHAEAIESAEAALEKSELVGNGFVSGNMLHEMAMARRGLSKAESNDDLRSELQEQALSFFNQSLEIKQQTRDSEGEAKTTIAKAELLSELGRRNEALKNAEYALNLGKEVGSVTAQRDAAVLLSELYRERKNFARALDMHILQVQMRDSSQSELNQREVFRQEYKYKYEKQAYADSLEFAKKEAIQTLEIEKRDANLAKQRIGLVATGGIVILLLLLALAIRRGKKRSDELLLNILPAEVAAELKQKGKTQSKRIDQVTVLFTDFKGFTAMAETMNPRELVEDLNICFSEFDKITLKYGIEKIKTIGDAYMAAGGLPTPSNDHAEKVIRAAFEMAEFIELGKARKIKAGLPFFEIRIGIHTGPVVAGIVGIKKFQYDIWGDTVNTASRMESSGEVGMVNISQTTYNLVNVNAQFEFESRGKIEAKGKGEMEMYFVKQRV